VQSDRFCDMPFDAVLHPLYRIYSFPAFRIITSRVEFITKEEGYS
jgi:hypothetical protein